MPVYFIRHGQSEFNATYRHGDADPMIFDAPLTSLGRRQAEETRAKVADLGISRVISSPLTRALQTSLVIFDGIAPITVAAGHHEKLDHSCDVGRSPGDLARDFPTLSFAHLPEQWWHQGPKNAAGVAFEREEVFVERMAGFDRSLRQLTERPLAIVGHGNAFKVLIGRLLENCEIHQYRPGTA